MKAYCLQLFSGSGLYYPTARAESRKGSLSFAKLSVFTPSRLTLISILNLDKPRNSAYYHVYDIVSKFINSYFCEAGLFQRNHFREVFFFL
jgi:hypothetical protein